MDIVPADQPIQQYQLVQTNVTYPLEYYNNLMELELIFF